MNSFVDEADYTEHVLWDVVLPLLTERRHKLIAASSAHVGGSFSAAVNARDDETGAPIVNSLVLGRPCDACARSSAPWECTHNLDLSAGWRDVSRQARVAQLFIKCGKEGQLLSELYSMSNMRSGAIFLPAQYEYLFADEPQYPAVPASIVYICVDPAGRGACDFAIAAVGQTQNTWLGYDATDNSAIAQAESADAKKYHLLALCAERVKGDPKLVRGLIHELFAALARHPRAGPNVPYIVAIEGMQQDVGYIGEMFQDMAAAAGLRNNVLVMTEFYKDETTGPGFGVPKMHATTDALATIMRNVLYQKMLCIPADCIALSPLGIVDRPKSLADLRNTLKVEFGTYSYDAAGGLSKAAGQNDLIIALQMAFLWGQAFCRSRRDDYLAFKMRYPHLVNAWSNGASAAPV